MSASEKLKRLEVRSFSVTRDGTVIYDVRPEVLVPALIAVVEAAEQFNFPNVTGEAWQNISSALAALDDALGEEA